MCSLVVENLVPFWLVYTCGALFIEVGKPHAGALSASPANVSVHAARDFGWQVFC
jgi:hypothetical protein